MTVQCIFLIKIVKTKYIGDVKYNTDFSIYLTQIYIQFKNVKNKIKIRLNMSLSIGLTRISTYTKWGTTNLKKIYSGISLAHIHSSISEMALEKGNILYLTQKHRGLINEIWNNISSCGSLRL